MIKYRLTLTKERDDIVDKDFTMCIEYALSDETALNLDPKYTVVEHLTEMLLEFFLKAKDEGDLPWNY